jgi:hypothetical protein
LLTFSYFLRAVQPKKKKKITVNGRPSFLIAQVFIESPKIFLAKTSRSQPLQVIAVQKSTKDTEA